MDYLGRMTVKPTIHKTRGRKSLTPRRAIKRAATPVLIHVTAPLPRQQSERKVYDVLDATNVFTKVAQSIALTFGVHRVYVGCITFMPGIIVEVEHSLATVETKVRELLQEEKGLPWRVVEMFNKNVRN